MELEKNVRIDPESHHRLKVLAAQKRVKMGQIVALLLQLKEEATTKRGEFLGR